MERLTERIKRLQKDDLIVYTNGKYEDTIPAEMTNDDIRAVLKKLAAYEDLEEQGLLVRLPCKVGTEVFCFFPGDSHYTKCQIKKNRNLSKHIWKYMLLCRASWTKGTLLQIF